MSIDIAGDCVGDDFFATLASANSLTSVVPGFFRSL